MSKQIIFKLPDAIDPNKILEEEIKRRYKKCPCCGETTDFPSSTTGKFVGETYFSWYGKQYEYTPEKAFRNWFIPPIKYWFEKSHHWQINSYFCTNCGMKWKSIAFPTDILSQKEVQNISSKLFE